MKSLGLITLLIAFVVGVWWTVGGPAPAAPADEVTTSHETTDTEVDMSEGVRVSQIEVYDGISVPSNTQVLDLSGRGLEGSLKAEIRRLQNLRVLDLSNNNFTGLPAEVGQLSELRTLNLSNNPFTGLPYELGNLQQLERLDLTGTQYAEQDLVVIKEQLPPGTEILVD